MAVISDFADLFVSVSEYMGRADFAHLFPRFVSMAELDIERTCLFERQHASVVLALTLGRAALPTDFHGVRSVRPTATGAMPIKRVSIHAVDDPACAAPGYTLDGTDILVYPTTVEEVRLDYTASIPRLTSVAPTNWLLVQAPDTLLYGTIYHAMIWANDERAEVVAGLFGQSMKAAQSDDRFQRFANSKMTVRGGLP